MDWLVHYVFRFGLLLYSEKKFLTKQYYRQLMGIQVLVDLSVRETRISFISMGMRKIDDSE